MSMTKMQKALTVDDRSNMSDSVMNELIYTVRSTRQFTCTNSAENVIAQLNLIAEIDRLFTQKQKSWGKWTLGFGLGCVVSFFLTVILAGLELGMLGLVVLIPCVLTTLYCGIMYWRTGQLNVEDRRHRIPAKLLEFLTIDIPPRRPVEIEVDFRHYKDSSTFQTAKEGSIFSSITNTEYEVPWFNLKGQLYDGSKFRLKIVQSAKLKEKRKRKRTKTTETFRDKYNLIVAVKPGKYPGLSKFQKLIANARPIDGLTISMTKVEGNRLTLQAVTPPKKYYSSNPANVPHRIYSADPALQMFLACYHCLGQCRTA